MQFGFPLSLCMWAGLHLLLKELKVKTSLPVAGGLDDDVIILHLPEWWGNPLIIIPGAWCEQVINMHSENEGRGETRGISFYINKSKTGREHHAKEFICNKRGWDKR